MVLNMPVGIDIYLGTYLNSQYSCHGKKNNAHVCTAVGYQPELQIKQIMQWSLIGFILYVMQKANYHFNTNVHTYCTNTAFL